MSSYPQSTSVAWDRSQLQVMTEPERVVVESLERSALSLEDYAAKLIQYAKSAAEVERRALASRRRAILRDAWGDLLIAYLKNWLRPETFTSVVGDQEDQADVSRNPAKVIWSELSVLYKSAPVRTTDPPAAGESYLKLLRGTHHDLFWQRVELYVEAFNDVLIWPAVVERDGRKVVRHRIATPDMVTVKVRDDDPTEVEALVILDKAVDEGGTEIDRYHFWTDAWHAVFDESANVDEDGNRELTRSDIGLEVGTNPYGRLPFVAIHRDPVETDFWNTSSGEDLVCLTLLVGRNRTCDHYARKMSGFTQILQWGDAPEEPVEQLRHESSVLQFTTGGQNGVREVTWSANLQERADLVDRDIAAAAASRGINPEKLKAGPSYQNTTSARLSERGLSERREAKVETFVVAEQEYYDAVARVANRVGLPGAPPEGAELEVEHAPMEYPDDPLSLAQYMRESVAIGVESPITLERRLHPTWSMERCKASVRQKIEDTAEIAEIKIKRNVPDDLNNRSQSDEENGAMGPVARDAPPGSPAGQPPQGEGVEERRR